MQDPVPELRTVALHEWHVVGPDGLPVTHRTVQVLRALRSGVRSYTFRFDRREVSVRAIRGAQALPPRQDAEGLTAVELRFPRPLRAGETASLEYETSFTWQSVPPPQVRRAARNRVERLDMRVTFSPERLPEELHWAVWDGYTPDSRMRAAERVTLDDEHSAHRFSDELDGVTVGFVWSWPVGQEPRVSVPAGTGSADDDARC